MKKLSRKLREEITRFNADTNVHDLPEIFHYWSNKYLRPMLEKFSICHPDDLFAENIFNSVALCEQKHPVFLSIGAGNCDTEIRVAKQLKSKGLNEFCFECLELSPDMLERGIALAEKEGVINNFSFIEADANRWHANKKYTSIMANQSLHHIENLESVFREIKKSLCEDGTFIISDIIGRNGHQRWTEALDPVNSFWNKLAQKYKYNHMLRRFEEKYENWDCSKEGFEGIRAQDILPLLIKEFHFQFFIGFGNVIDIFIDRAFGHNFNPNNKWDTDFIDEVHKFDEDSICKGTIKPTHIMAVMKKHPVKMPVYSRGLSPEHCVRYP